MSDEDKALYSHTLENIKAVNKVKHPNKDTLIWKTKLLRIYDALYEAAAEELLGLFTVTGLRALAPLAEDDAREIDYLFGASDNPETKDPQYTPMSQMLRNKWTGQDELYCIPGLLWQYAEALQISVAAI